MRRFRSVVVLGVSAALVSGARAAVSVSDVSGSSGGAPTLHYLLNEAAASGSITVVDAYSPDAVLVTIPLGDADLARGPHDVTFTPDGLPAGDYLFTVHVAAAPHTGYDVIAPSAPIAAGASVRYGARFNRAPGTPAFGHLFIADAGTHSLHEFNGAGLFVQDVAAGAGAYPFMGVAVGADGALYSAGQDTNSIVRYAAYGPTAMPEWIPVQTYTGVPAANGTDGTLFTRAFQIIGTGDAARAYLSAYPPVPNTGSTAVLGDTVNAPAALFNAGALAGNRVDQILVSDDETTAYASSGGIGGQHLNKWLHGPNPANGNTVEWYLDPGFSENNPALATLTGQCRGLAFSPDGQSLYATQANVPGGSPAHFIARLGLSQAGSLALAVRALRVAGGLDASTAADVPALNRDGDASINLPDAFRLMTSTGGVLDKIPTPDAVPVPILVDCDAKGNIALVSTAAPSYGTAGDTLTLLAPPDNGSSDYATSAPFSIQ